MSQSCQVCQQPILSSKRTGSIYCSDACRVKAARDRAKTIDELIAKLTSKGYDARRGSEVPKVEYVSTGIAEIDAITGGFPTKRISEVYGSTSVGKTSLLLKMIASLSKNHKVLFVDVEETYSPEWAKKLGITEDNITVMSPEVLEDIADAVIDGVKLFDVIVIDSVAAMIPRAEIEGEMGEAHMGLKARLMGQFMRKLTTPLFKTNCAVIFINQQRESMELYGAKKFTPGGNALPYAASLRLELKTTKAERIVKNSEVIGHWINVEVTKSKVGTPYQKARFKLLYE